MFVIIGLYILGRNAMRKLGINVFVNDICYFTVKNPNLRDNYLLSCQTSNAGGKAGRSEGVTKVTRQHEFCL